MPAPRHRPPGSTGRQGLRVAAVAAAAGLAACSGGEDAGRVRTRPAPPPVYVAVGASESVGEGADDPPRQAWTVVFRRRALPERAVFVNLGVPGSNTEEALAAQVPEAVGREPDLVTVWLNVNDIVDRVAADRYEGQLRDAVRRLRRGGRTKVLVANTPEVDRLPAVAGLGPVVAALADRAVDAYNRATARVVAGEGAVLVDLHAASRRADQDGRLAALVSADGFHPSTRGHAEVATLFVRAFRSSGGLASD